MFKSFALLTFGVLLLVGCGDSTKDANLHHVEGTVSVDGKPIDKEGYTVYFESTGPEGRGVTLNVSADGSYAGDVGPGSNSVTLNPPASEGGEGGGHGEHSESGQSGYLPQSIDVSEGGEKADFNFTKN